MMEVKLTKKVHELTEDFLKGLKIIFTKDALLNISINYGADAVSSGPPPKRRGPKPKGMQSLDTKTSTTGAKRGPKPKVRMEDPVPKIPKKRGRKPKSAVE